jgi:hypothetical protein
LFKDKKAEMMADEADPKHLLSVLEARNLKQIQESNAQFFFQSAINQVDNPKPPIKRYSKLPL